jgi:flavorubredoxin
MITNAQSGTRVDEIAESIYRISTPVTVLPGGFTFNQYLVDDEQPLLYHTGPRRLFELTGEAVAAVMPLERLRWIGLSHFEADECGALNAFLAAAPRATPLCSRLAAMVSVDDYADRPARGLTDGEQLALGARSMRWIDTPHMPHAWECGMLVETTSRTLFCGDLFTQGGAEHAPLTEADILAPSEAMRARLDYFAHAPTSRALLEHLACEAPTTLACMHGSAWRGDGSALLRELAGAIEVVR